MSNKYYPVAFILLIVAAVYVMYGQRFKPNIDTLKYKEVCELYSNDSIDKYSFDDKQMLINQVNYALPEKHTELNDAIERELKICIEQLTIKINQ